MSLGFSYEPGSERWDQPPKFDIPIRQVWSLRNKTCSMRPNAIEAYVCCCFSELAYLHLTDREIDRAGRYKSVPSLAFQALVAHGKKFDLTMARRDLDFPSFVFETEQFVYAGFEVADVTIVAVRGSVGWSDWATNLRVFPQLDRASGGRLHSGFLHEAIAAKPRLLEHLRAGRASRVLFTGHSLGGAVAATLHVRWSCDEWLNNYISMAPYTFGAPRYGDASIRDKTQVFAYVKPFDLVPHLPTRFFGYVDTGTQSMCLANGSRAPLPSCWEIARAWLRRPGGPAFAREHTVELYRRELGATVAPAFPDLVYWEFAKSIMAKKIPVKYEAPP